MNVTRATAALWLAGWIGVGLLFALDLLLALSLFPLLIVSVPITVLAFHQLESRRGPDSAKWGLALGMAALPFFFAYTNRHGPGTWCHPIGTPQYPGTQCDEQWDPRPFAVAGTALVLGALLAPLIARRRQAARQR